MSNIGQLEKKWYRYKAKGIISLASNFGLVGALGLGSYYASTQIEMSKHILESEIVITQTSVETPAIKILESKPVVIAKPLANTIESVKRETEVVLTNKNEGMKSNDLYEVSLEPIIPIIDMEREERKSSHTKKYVSASPKSTATGRVKAKLSTYLTASELATINRNDYRSTPLSRDTRSIKKINLNASSDNYIETITKKFEKSKKPREALLLAKAFYAEKNYQKSEEWALKANKLDSNLEESWCLFAKSKAKLGKKDEAIKILASYYKKSRSSKAKALIVKIKTERL